MSLRFNFPSNSGRGLMHGMPGDIEEIIFVIFPWTDSAEGIICRRSREAKKVYAQIAYAGFERERENHGERKRDFEKSPCEKNKKKA